MGSRTNLWEVTAPADPRLGYSSAYAQVLWGTPYEGEA